MNNFIRKFINFVRFIEYFTFNTFFWRVGMKFQTKLIATCILLASRLIPWQRMLMADVMRRLWLPPTITSIPAVSFSKMTIK